MTVAEDTLPVVVQCGNVFWRHSRGRAGIFLLSLFLELYNTIVELMALEPIALRNIFAQIAGTNTRALYNIIVYKGSARGSPRAVPLTPTAS